MAVNRQRIGIGYQILAILVFLSLIVVFINIIIFNSFVKEFRFQSKTFSVYQPSIEKLNKFNEMNLRSISLLKNWVFIDKDTGTIQKNELSLLHETEYPKLKEDIFVYLNSWDKDEQNMYFDVISAMDSLITKEQYIMDELAFFDDYQNTEVLFEIFPMISDKGEIISQSERVTFLINKLNDHFEMEINNYVDLAKDRFSRLKMIITWYTILIVGLLIFVAFFIFRNIFFISTTINQAINKIRYGTLPTVKKLNRRDEVGELNQNLIGLIEYLKTLSNFAGLLGQNKFDTAFSPASDSDVLGNSLLHLRDNLVKAKKDEEFRQTENTNRNWAAQGIAEFNEVLRKEGDNLESLTKAVIEKLVHYTNSNIGGLFIVNDEDQYSQFLELKSFYAYDRHKYLDNKIQFGETLIGQCYMEKDTIYINDVPDDYLYVTSGLGTDKPKSILIIPLMINEIIYGVIELASFREFEDFEIDFVKKISETIASAISSAKINERTRKLLEESNEKSKRLELQEVEARERIENVNKQVADLEKMYNSVVTEKENLQRIQFEMDEKIKKLEKHSSTEIEKEKEKSSQLLFVLNQTIPYYEMSANGDIIYANDLFLKSHNLPANEVINVKHAKMLTRDFVNSGSYKQIWDKLKQKEKVDTSVQYLIEGKTKLLNEVFVPVTDSEGNIVKVSVFGRM